VAETSSNGAFALDQPAGYADAQAQSCIWRFTAKQAGSQSLTIVKGPVCRPGVVCPQSSIAFDMTLTATT
jgi:hypothetical protein